MCNDKKNNYATNGSCLYFMGFIGAAVYYISAAAGFWAGAMGFLKAMVWPAFMVYEGFKALAA